MRWPTVLYVSVGRSVDSVSCFFFIKLCFRYTILFISNVVRNQLNVLMTIHYCRIKFTACVYLNDFIFNFNFFFSMTLVVVSFSCAYHFADDVVVVIVGVVLAGSSTLTNAQRKKRNKENTHAYQYRFINSFIVCHRIFSAGFYCILILLRRRSRSNRMLMDKRCAI